MMIAFDVEQELHDVYQDEAWRLSLETGKRVTLKQVMTDELVRGKKRILSRRETKS